MRRVDLEKGQASQQGHNDMVTVSSVHHVSTRVMCMGPDIARVTESCAHTVQQPPCPPGGIAICDCEEGLLSTPNLCYIYRVS